MLVVLSVEQSWWSAWADVWECIGLSHCVLSLQGDALVEFTRGLFKPRNDCFFVRDNDGELVMLHSVAWELVQKLGWDGWDEWCKKNAGYDRKAKR